MSTPASPRPDDEPRRGPNLPIVLFVVALVVIAVVVAFLAGRSGRGPLAESPAASSSPGTDTGTGTGSSTGTGTSTGSADGVVADDGAVQTCVPGPDVAAPTLDLGVQPSTGAATLIPQRRVERLVGLAADAGAGVISTSTSWRYLQPSEDTPVADFRFEGIDGVVRAAERAGLGVRVQLIGIPRWAADDPDAWTEETPPTSDAELRRWTTFVTAVARHLAGRVDYLEVWNEPNGEVYWPGGPDPAGFARLLAATYAPVKAVASDLQVVSGGLVGNDLGYLETLYQALTDLQISPQPFDLLGVHPFTGAEPPTTVDPGRIFERPPYGLVDDNFTGFEALHDVVVERGTPGTDLYISAFGYGSRSNRGDAAVPDDVRATYATEALEVVSCAPYVRAFSWYYLHPTPFDPVSWTLLDADLRPTATYDALVAWADEVAASGAPAR